MLKINEDYLRSSLFGLQDGLVSTTGMVVGISIGIENKAVIILASFVTLMVEATSMAAGQYSSEKAVHQLNKTKRHKDDLFIGAVIMFVSYILAGLLPITPTIIFNQPQARIISIIFAFVGLFAIGFIKGKIVNIKPLRSAIELFLIGGIATLVGVVVGSILRV